MHVAYYCKARSSDIAGMDPQKLSVKLVLPFNKLLDSKLDTATNEVLLVHIKFVKLVS